MFLRKNFYRLITYLPFIFVCFAVPWLFFCMFLQYFTFEVWDEKSEYIENIGYLGSFFSGFTALIIVGLTALAVYFSYNGYKQEAKRVKQQRFEDHFFHLLEIHRENLKMMEIEHKNFDFRNKMDKGSYTSSKVILKIFRELMVMIEFVAKKAKEHTCLVNLNSVNSRATLVYLCFYYGFGSRSKEILNHELYSFGLKCYEDELLRNIFCDSEYTRSELKKLKVQYKNSTNKSEIDKELDNIYNSMIRKKISDKADIKYKAAGGHQTRLDHYFANLLFCFELIEEHRRNMLNDDLEIYKKELMSQLNVYEKILLVLHSNANIGQDFQKYLLDYDFEKYIPKGMLKEEEFDLSAYLESLNDEQKV